MLAAKHHPVVLRLNAERAEDFQLRLADQITAFAGSMPFVYLHVLAFGTWMVFLEKSPWPTLTLIVSLEAIFLSTFVMIGQNRSTAFQQAKADHDFQEEEQELHLNTDLTRDIHTLTREVHERIVSGGSRPLVEKQVPGKGGSIVIKQGERLLDDLNAATVRKGDVVKRFTSMKHPVDPNDPVFTEWDSADADERHETEVVRQFWLRPAP